MMVRVIIQFMSKKSKLPKMTLSIIFLIAIFF